MSASFLEDWSAMEALHGLQRIRNMSSTCQPTFSCCNKFQGMACTWYDPVQS